MHKAARNELQKFKPNELQWCLIFALACLSDRKSLPLLHELKEPYTTSEYHVTLNHLVIFSVRAPQVHTMS